MKIGYFLSCEEFGPRDLIEQARMAEEAGFEALWISDHYHPWISAGPEPVRLVGDRWPLGCFTPAGYNRCGLSHHAYPPGDHSPSRRNLRGDARRAFRSGRWQRGEPQRAH